MDCARKLLAPVGALVVGVIFDGAVVWLEDPVNRHRLADLLPSVPTVVDKATDTTPSTWDDRIIDPAVRMASSWLSKVGWR